MPPTSFSPPGGELHNLTRWKRRLGAANCKADKGTCIEATAIADTQQVGAEAERRCVAISPSMTRVHKIRPELLEAHLAGGELRVAEPPAPQENSLPPMCAYHG
jgi:hypothetical protein